MSTAFKPLEIPPGVVALATKKMRSSNWAEVNCVRWTEGQISPIGGQSQYTYSFASRCKRIHGWYGLDNIYRIAYLCEDNLYIDVGGQLFDISPMPPITPPMSLTQGGYGDGPYGQNVLFNAASAWTTASTTITLTGGTAGILVGQDVYNVTKSLDVGVVQSIAGNVVTLTAPAAVAGAAHDVLGFDWYGMPRSEGLIFALDKTPDAFSLDNFGSILYAMTSPDGRLLMWDPSKGSPGVIVTLAAASAPSTSSPNITMPANPGTVTPGMSVYDNTTNKPLGTVLTYSGTALVLTANALNAGAIGDQLAFGNVAVTQPADSGRGPVPNGRFFVVTPERFLVIFGTYNDGTTGGGSTRRFAWCDQENPAAWDYANVVSQAGFLDIEPASPIISGISTRTGILFFTGKKAYRSRFLGFPYVYNYEELADNCTPWSPQSMATTSSMVLWMSEQGVFSFDGTSILPVACMVRSWVDDDIDILNVREQACAVHISTFNEWWWFFPQLNQPYNTRAIVYGYKEGWWSQARMSRSAGVTASYNIFSILADGKIAIQHEEPLIYSSVYVNADPPFAETFDLNLVGGGKLVTVKQLLPDIEMEGLTDPTQIAYATQQLRYSLFYRNSRSIGDPELQTDFKAVTPNGYVNFRTTGRDVRLRIDLAPGSVVPFVIGQHQIDIVQRGDR